MPTTVFFFAYFCDTKIGRVFRIFQEDTILKRLKYARIDFIKNLKKCIIYITVIIICDYKQKYF